MNSAPERDGRDRLAPNKLASNKLTSNKLVATRYCVGDPDRGLENVDVWDEVCAPDIALVGSPGLPELRGLEAFKALTRQVRTSFTNVVTSVDEMIAEDDTVAVRWSASATAVEDVTMQNGLGVPGGKTVHRTGISIIRLRDGKVVEETTYEDRLGFLEQLRA